jgi:hypothetical protein
MALQYPASVTPGGSQFVTGARAMSLQLAAASNVYVRVHYTLKKKSGGGRKGSCPQAGKCTAVQVC